MIVKVGLEAPNVLINLEVQLVLLGLCIKRYLDLPSIKDLFPCLTVSAI